uniref:EF-hand domain-containing protein n=1 Tax=Oryza meridionalis TaxID=40149 RepID=A0A0E0D8N5_9ORYZ
MASIDRGLAVSVSSLLIISRGVRAVSRALVRLALLLVHVVDEDDDYRYCAAAAAGDDGVQLVMASIDRGLAVSVSSLLIISRGVRAVSRALVRLALLLVHVVDEDDDYRYCAAAAAGDDGVVQPPRLRCCERCAAAPWLSRHDVAAVVASLGLVAADEDDEEGDHQAPCGACEAVAAVEKLAESKVAGEGELREAFRVFDRDGDGYVSAAELRSVLRRLGMEEGARHADCVRMIAAHDGDGDGRISFQEFRAMMENAV